ncbi:MULTISPECIES: hypothetical protein [unclassified Microcoleus]|uniref:hypothetical protein n=1 Tax=unclassified Microcoleus TaxID=2642155 RepID=UPI002FCFAC1E
MKLFSTNFLLRATFPYQQERSTFLFHKERSTLVHKWELRDLALSMKKSAIARELRNRS